MIVNAPQIEYDVTIPPMDIEPIDECIVILEDILDIMDKHNCDSLDYGYADCPEYITSRNIKDVAHLLFNLKEVHTML